MWGTGGNTAVAEGWETRDDEKGAEGLGAEEGSEISGPVRTMVGNAKKQACIDGEVMPTVVRIKRRECMEEQLMTKFYIGALAESMQKCDLRVTIEYLSTLCASFRRC